MQAHNLRSSRFPELSHRKNKPIISATGFTQPTCKKMNSDWKEAIKGREWSTAYSGKTKLNTQQQQLQSIILQFGSGWRNMASKRTDTQQGRK